MSTTDAEPNQGDRYATPDPRRNAVAPRLLAVAGAVAGLALLGYFANGVVQHFISPPPPLDRAPSSQTQVSAPPPLQLPQDTAAPAREQQQAVAAPPPLPQPTVMQQAREAVGVGSPTRAVLIEPDKDWDKIGTTPRAGAFGPSTPPSEADQAAVAFGAKPAATNITGSRATAVADLTRTIRPGTRLFCTTQEALDTTTGAGGFVCKVDRWVQAWDGMTPLIPPASWVTVHYEELKNGRDRVFAASGLLTTPDGVVVSLGDPFTMPDGSGGIAGVIQDNTWARLKEGIILDFAQSAFQAAESLASKQNQGSNSSSLNFNVNTNNTQQAVNSTLEKNINIPDVLRLAEGAHISMTIMHPVFMQDVVSFVMRARQ